MQGPDQAAADLKAFITSHGLGLKPAADSLGVSHPALFAWLRSAARPNAFQRKKLEIWTGGKVCETDWLTQEELRGLGRMKEFGK